MSGWIKLHRQLQQSAVFDNPKLLKVWIWMLLKATHKEHKQIVGRQAVTLQPGQFVFGRDAAAEVLGMPPSTVRAYMKLLEEIGNITLDSNNKYTLVTVENWALYQGDDEIPDNKRTANEQQTENKRKTNGHKQEVQEHKECKEVKSTPAKKKFAEFVTLTEDEHAKLVERLGEQGADRAIEILDNYKGSKGKKYKSDYRAILSWVEDRLYQEQPRGDPPKYQHQRTDLTDLQKVIERKTMRGL